MAHQRGFTTMELIVVIVIVSIIAVISVSRYSSQAVFDLNSITDQVKRDIRYTQTLAMGLNTSYTITLTSGGYSISPAPLIGSSSVTLPSGVTLTPATITFDANGKPNAATTVTVTTSSGSNVLTLYLQTGFIDG